MTGYFTGFFDAKKKENMPVHLCRNETTICGYNGDWLKFNWVANGLTFDTLSYITCRKCKEHAQRYLHFHATDNR